MLFFSMARTIPFYEVEFKAFFTSNAKTHVKCLKNGIPLYRLICYVFRCMSKFYSRPGTQQKYRSDNNPSALEDRVDPYTQWPMATWIVNRVRHHGQKRQRLTRYDHE